METSNYKILPAVFVTTLVFVLFFLTNTKIAAQLRFNDSFENGFNPHPSNAVYNQWYKSGWNNGGFMAPTDEITARRGNLSLKAVMVRNTDGISRTETGINLANSFGHYWYGFSIYIPSEIDFSKVVTNGSWHTVLAQWGVWLNNPGLPDFALRMNDTKFRLTYEPSTGNPITLWEAPLIQGRWVDWAVHINWTRDNSGIFEVWQDQVQIFKKTNFQSTDGDGEDVKSKIGLYYSDWGSQSSDLNSIYCYYDVYKIAKGENELMSVAPWAEGSSDFAPSSLTATAVSKSRIQLNWKDNSDDELGFIIERKSDGEFEEISRTAADVTAYSDSGLAASTEYTYRITAYNSEGIIGFSNESKTETFTIGGVYSENNGIVSIEAEHGQLGERWIIRENAVASNGRFIEMNETYNHQDNIPACVSPECIASYFFDIGNMGDYKIWFKLLSEGESHDSFFWRLNDNEWILEESFAGIGEWNYSESMKSNFIKLGANILEIAYRESGTQLDKFVIQLGSLPNITGDGPVESNGTGITPPLFPSDLKATAISDKQIDLTWKDNSIDEDGFKIERKAEGTSYWLVANLPPNTTVFSDKLLLSPSKLYTYRIRAYANDLFSNYSNESSDTTLPNPTFVNNQTDDQLPERLELLQNYPNPANPSTTITFTIPSRSDLSNHSNYVKLEVFDILGSKVATLLNELKTAGKYSLTFNPFINNPNITSGTYLYRLTFDNIFITKKLSLVK